MRIGLLIAGRNFLPNTYPPTRDKNALKQVVEELGGMPPLVYAGEARKLLDELGEVSEGRAFLLQGGECAESFEDYSTENIHNFYRLFMQMTMILAGGINKKIVRVGRIAGQFAKPRSNDYEVVNGEVITSYRGDIINSIEKDSELRKPDPHRMITAYHQTLGTLNLLRGFTMGGYGHHKHMQNWNLPFAKNENVVKTWIAKYENYFDYRKFYVSHEALLLPYEQAFTRRDSTSGDYYDTSAHMVWIGDRTRDSQAHIEFCRGIENPLGMKIGVNTSPRELVYLLNRLNPSNKAGRLTLICRFGVHNIASGLPPLIDAVKRTNAKVVWSCDPMHGNTIKSISGYKMRLFSAIKDEIKKFVSICKEHNIYPGGLHLEMTGENVTECVGGEDSPVTEENLQDRYHTQCDPRLNANQAVELSNSVGKIFGGYET